MLCRPGGVDLAVGVKHARQAHGRDGHRHPRGLSSHGCCGAAVFHVHRHALAKQYGAEIGLVGAVRGLGPRASVDIVVEHARHAALRYDTQIFYAGHSRERSRHWRTLALGADLHELAHVWDQHTMSVNCNVSMLPETL